MSKLPTNEIILGVDPGTVTTGYGLVKKTPLGLQVIDFGCIRPAKNARPEEKYFAIFTGIEALIKQYAPDAIAVETQFVKLNPQSAIKLGMARGAVLIAGAKHQCPSFEYAPKAAKLAVVGNGSASKTQVQKMIQLLLGLPTLPQPEDAADALAIAICHLQRKPLLHIR